MWFFRSLFLLISTVLLGSSRIPPRHLHPFVPTITLQFLASLSADDLEAIERANTDLQRLKSQGSDLSDVEHGLVVRPYSEKAYGHVAAFEEAITRLYLSLPRSIQEAIDQVLKDKATLDFSELEDHQRLVDYAILASETFNTLKRNEQDMLARAFPNYATLFRDPDFWAISGHGTNQRQAAEHFIGKLIGNRRHRL